MNRRTVHRPQAFTLIELVLVMMLMSVLAAIVAPRLSDFMAGRTVNEEVRRLIALTHAARSEAIARNERMALWIDPATGEYGLRSEDEAEAASAGAASGDNGDDAYNPKQYKLADRLSFEMDSDTQYNEAGEATAIFWPDGTIDDESFQGFTLMQGEDPQRAIVLSDNRLEYLAENPA
jgi:prepilin-type N-terminal cleavage/methylation domain-containing protein